MPIFRKQFFAFAVAAAPAALMLGVLAPAHAQRSTPVKEVGQTPYQWAFSVTATGNSEVCTDNIPVPAGKMLTITNVGLSATAPSSSAIPDAYLRIVRSAGGGSNLRRMRGTLLRTSTTGYKGNYNIEAHVGAASGGAVYTARMCVRADTSSNGVVSGYVTDFEIIDGNSLP